MTALQLGRQVAEAMGLDVEQVPALMLHHLAELARDGRLASHVLERLPVPITNYRCLLCGMLHASTEAADRCCGPGGLDLEADELDDELDDYVPAPAVDRGRWAAISWTPGEGSTVIDEDLARAHGLLDDERDSG